MSLDCGLAAFSLEMPERIPRTEYSASTHWQLVNTVTGSEINAQSTPEQRQAATSAFVKSWEYDFVYNTPVDEFIFGDKRTSMGHAQYATDGVDYDNKVFSLFEEPQQVFQFDFEEQYGALSSSLTTKWFNANYQQQKDRYPNVVNTTGIYVSCISGLIELCGWDILLQSAGEDPKAFGDFTNRYINWLKPYFEGLAECEAPIVSMHDDIVWSSGPFLSPAWYREYVFPNYIKCIEPLRSAGKKILYICDGCYDIFVDDIAKCGVNGFVMEPLTDMAAVAQRYGKTHVIVGNADTRILLNGTKEEIYNEVKRCTDIGRDCPGFFMAVGNHIPSNTPVENALYYNEIYNKLSRR